MVEHNDDRINEAVDNAIAQSQKSIEEVTFLDKAAGDLAKYVAAGMDQSPTGHVPVRDGELPDGTALTVEEYYREQAVRGLKQINPELTDNDIAERVETMIANAQERSGYIVEAEQRVSDREWNDALKTRKGELAAEQAENDREWGEALTARKEQFAALDARVEEIKAELQEKFASGVSFDDIREDLKRNTDELRSDYNIPHEVAAKLSGDALQEAYDAAKEDRSAALAARDTLPEVEDKDILGEIPVDVTRHATYEPRTAPEAPSAAQRREETLAALKKLDDLDEAVELTQKDLQVAPETLRTERLVERVETAEKLGVESDRYLDRLQEIQEQHPELQEKFVRALAGAEITQEALREINSDPLNDLPDAEVSASDVRAHGSGVSKGKNAGRVN